MRLPGVSFKVETSQEILDDLIMRLRQTRFPKEEISGDWRYGTPLNYARRLRDYWADAFNWRGWEARINQFSQRLVDIDGVRLHVLVEEGSGDNPMPIILTHGWPGSFLEFIELVEPLAHPERFGGNIEDAFTVVLPSLPGYGFSPAPAAPIPPKDIAALWSKLMTEHFGFTRYVAQGGDWGGAITSCVALFYPRNLVAIHQNMGGLIPLIDADSPPLTEEEMAYIQRSRSDNGAESGYQLVQGTKPQSLAFGQTDSPMGLASWIAEKFQGWTVPGMNIDPPFSMDRIIANIMLYWLGGSTAPTWLYLYLRDLEQLTAPKNMRVEVPCRFLLFAKDLVLPPPASWIERVYNLRSYEVREDGGHFPAMENGALLVEDIRTFFRTDR